MCLITARCILRPPTREDKGLIVALSIDSDVRRFIGGPLSTEQARERAERLIVGAEVKHCWVVEVSERAEQGPVGLVHISGHHDADYDELSYEFLPVTWGKGIATEAVAAALTHTFVSLGYDRLVSETQAANLQSRRLLERLGMNRVRTLDRFGEAQVLYAIDQSSVRQTRSPTE